MPRYYFNVRDGVPLITDHVGIVLPDMDAAISEAHREAALVVSGLKGQRSLLQDMKITICDGQGQVLQRIDLPDVLDCEN